MWFRNLQIYRLRGWKATPSELDDILSRHPLEACSGASMQSIGWLQPREGAQVHSQGGQMLISLGVEKKLLPASVVNQYARARAEEIGEKQGYKPGRKQMREIKEAVAAELMPRAFSIRRSTFAWIDPEGGWLVVDSASQAKAEELLEALRKAAVEFEAALIRTRVSPASAMTAWLAGDEPPAVFSVDRDCELRSMDDERAKVRYAHHALDTDEVRRHIGAGKEVTRLAMTWDDRISFVLDDAMQLKRIAPLDILKDQADESEDAFETDFALMTGEFSRLIPDLLHALGGEENA